MTEAELFRAVHEYADTTARSDVGAHGVTAYVFDEEARNKFLEAIREWAIHQEILSGEKTRDDVLAWLKRVQLFEAKAAVCDAYLQYTGGWSGIPKVFVKLYKAAQELKKLQEKAP